MEHLEITDDDKKVEELTSVLAGVATSQPRILQTLCVFLCQWDTEILFPIVKHFTNLRRLEIKYQEGGPSEVHFVLLHSSVCDP